LVIDSFFFDSNHPSLHHSRQPTTVANSTDLYESESELEFSVEGSPLARLMGMLDYPVLRSSAQLMDKMFTCLAHASAGIPLVAGEATVAGSGASATQQAASHGMSTISYQSFSEILPIEIAR
jgi:hypothetical protein